MIDARAEIEPPFSFRPTSFGYAPRAHPSRRAHVHARHEERYEFPRLRQHVPADRLRQLATAVRAAEAAAPTRPHPGTETATANAVAGIPLAVIDRIRDAMKSAAE